MDQVRAGRVAGIIVEPIQAEGGDRHASPWFFQQLQVRAKAAGAALILDEVQTGVAITGKMWAHEHWYLQDYNGGSPDMVTFGGKAGVSGVFSN